MEYKSYVFGASLAPGKFVEEVRDQHLQEAVRYTERVISRIRLLAAATGNVRPSAFRKVPRLLMFYLNLFIVCFGHSSKCIAYPLGLVDPWQSPPPMEKPLDYLFFLVYCNRSTGEERRSLVPGYWPLAKEGHLQLGHTKGDQNREG